MSSLRLSLPRLPLSRARVTLPLALLALLPAASPVAAQTAIAWNNTTGTTTPFATGTNWTGNTAPADSLTANIAHFGTAPGQTVSVATRSVAGITFGSGAGSFALTGSSSVLTLGAAGIDNAATTASSQIASSLPLALGASASFTQSGSTNFTYNSSIDTAGFGLTLGGAGSGVANINGAIGGTGSVTKTGTADWRLLGGNTYSGGTTVNQGALLVNTTGTLPTGGHITINGTTASSTTSIAINSSAAQNIGTLTFGGTGATSTSTNLLQLNAGTTTLGGTVTYSATNNPLGASINGNGTLALGGNRIFNLANSSNATFDLTVNSTITGPENSLTVSGGGTLKLGGSNTYSGGTTVTSVDGFGRLFVTNTAGSGTGSGPVSIQSGAQLRGSGFISGLTTIAGGATLAPGATFVPGTLTFNGGLSLLATSSVTFQLGSVSSDKIAVFGGVLAGPASGTITLNLISPSDTSTSGAFAAGTYTLFDFTSGGTTTSNFNTSSFTFGSTISGYTYSLGFSGNNLQVTAVSAIPEPSTYAAIFGTAVLAGAVWHRRRRQITA